jgi:hypothetical protein
MKYKYTLWTNPRSNWTHLNFTITPTIQKAIERALRKIDLKKLTERTKAFR